MQKPTARAYWFQALINRNGCMMTRQGTVQGAYAVDALSQVKEMAKEWGMPMMDCAIFAIDEEGAVGRQILKTSGSGNGIQYTANHAYNNHTRVKRPPEPKPYEFGTYWSAKAFPTFTFMEDTGNG